MQAEQMAMAGRIAAGVAHEMNNPLTAVSYYAQALSKSLAKKPKDREKVKSILESADRIQRLLARLLNYTSLARAEFIPMDLNAVVKQVLDAISHEIEKRPKTKLSLHLDPDLPQMLGAREHLFHLISNLVINSLLALPEEKGKIEIYTAAKEQGIELIVKDTGVGISEEDLPRIFEPFFSRRAGGQGTGLGLAIVQQVARRHQAVVEVESKPGQGASFKVFFPKPD